jgi:hypothetical protein
MDEELLELYRRIVSRAAQLSPELRGRLGCPFFPLPRDGWQHAKRRIVLVGQDPHDHGFNSGEHYPWPHPDLWSLDEALACPDCVQALTWAYKTHTSEIPSPYRPSPFTMAFDQFTSHASCNGDAEVVSTNVFRCALYIDEQPNSKSPLNGTESERVQIMDWQRGCLREEITILDPTSVVFFTGPLYDEVLRDEFPGVEFTAYDDRPSRQFACVTHAHLPVRSFRTYHPGYLVRSRQRRAWINEIAAMVTA